MRTQSRSAVNTRPLNFHPRRAMHATLLVLGLKRLLK